MWSWGGKPLTDGATHTARRAAHDCFDALWRAGALTRGEAYRRLQEALGLTADECHMARMTLEQAQRVPPAVAQILRDLDDACGVLHDACLVRQQGLGEEVTEQ